ncbi:hypothetical protein FEM48_Zijuj12G0138900 [Ziziphus jujuba var. spinosa]|uniref:RNA-dependent RNA polymerase n=1 Tax=Ziziphus jujuba var. spinosa TaxID=714518 RepID=A0A978UDQ4_ZIZJJ|nr:hypothetical protein FEM48_Zijuj12G0138900 [Ziziphus jujuba var. spinosa]
MADPSSEVLLPPSVEQLIQKICIEQNQTPPHADLKRKLADRGEEESLRILNDIARQKIRTNLSACINHWLKNNHHQPNSPCSSPSKPPFVARLYGNPQDSLPSTSEAVPDFMVTEPPRESERAVLEALGELQFRKQFLILSYSGGKELQTVISAEEIRRLKDLPMILFEQKYLDWDCGKTHIYHCHVSLNGNTSFKGPYLYKTRTHLQKVLGDDNVLIVKFKEEDKDCPLCYYYGAYSKIAKEGISVGLRRYRFFVFKDGGKEEKKKNPTSSPVKCYFIRLETDAFIDKVGSYKLSNRTVAEARSYFMHAHTVSSVPTYMARLSLILSKTISLETDLSSVNVEPIRDEYCKDEHGNCIFRDGEPLVHTDGTGFISKDLALLCPKNLQKGEHLSKEDNERILNHDEPKDKVLETKLEFKSREPPLLIQFRLFYNGCAVKGTFLLNKKIRDYSMVKVKRDENLSNNQTANSMEIVGTSNPPKKTHLSRNLIALLSRGGVPNEYFMNILEKALQETHGAFSNKRAARRESWLQYRLSILMKEEKRSIRERRLYVPECYYLMGTADPTGKLESDEVCIVLDNEQVSGKVLVYRNPGLHFGDIHVLKATYGEELESFVGNSKYAIFFSCKGPRSIADEIAGDDFDGDMYWISRNPQLLEYFKPSEPWNPSSSMPKVANKEPNQFSNEELDDELFKLFLRARFQPSFAMSEAADSWLALMDRFLTLDNDNAEEKIVVKQKMLQLIDIYYDALDAPKNGGKVEVPNELRVRQFPHYMKKNKCYTSTSILGLIYDAVRSYQEEDHSNKEISKLPCFDVEVPEACYTKWNEHYGRYLAEMSNAVQDEDKVLRNEAADQVIKKYKEILYEAEEFEQSERNIEDISLLKFYAMKQNEKPFMRLPSVMRELF